MVLLSVRKPTILGPIAFKATYVANFQYTAIFQPTTIKYLNNGYGIANSSDQDFMSKVLCYAN